MTELADLSASLAASASAAEVLRSGFHCAIVGYPNAGKSSLFNALLQRDRAIVSPLPGTTRDYLSETLFMQGFSLLMHDTAGIRATSDTIELQGIHLTTSLIEQSNLVLVVNDLSQGADHSDALVADVHSRFPTSDILVVQNKSDLAEPAPTASNATALKTIFSSETRFKSISCSATSGAGLDLLRAELLQKVLSSTEGVQDVLVNNRQATLLSLVSQHLKSAIDGLDAGVSTDCVAIDIRSALRLLGEITGETWSPDVLEAVFSRFCIGK